MVLFTYRKIIACRTHRFSNAAWTIQVELLILGSKYLKLFRLKLKIVIAIAIKYLKMNFNSTVHIPVFNYFIGFLIENFLISLCNFQSYIVFLEQ